MHEATPDPRPSLRLTIHGHVWFILVTPHYPENVGAAARAIKTMGFEQLVLVKPGRLAHPDNEMARKMAVKSGDVLSQTRVLPTLDEAVRGAHHIVATTSRRGVSGVLSPRELAPIVVQRASMGQITAVLFGNEKTGLSANEVDAAPEKLRIPMAGAQPSINLAQATQLVAYEFMTAALLLDRGQR